MGNLIGIFVIGSLILWLVGGAPIAILPLGAAMLAVRSVKQNLR